MSSSRTTPDIPPVMFRSAVSILRAQLSNSTDPIICPGVYDGFTARIALAAGFSTLYMTGAGTSASRLGSPDLALLTLTEMHQNANMIAALDPSVPLIADADTGFGGPLSVARTVSMYINSNIAALHLEDQVPSKRCGHLLGKELVDVDVFLSRIRAAVLARQQSGRDIVLIARTDALQSLGMEEAIARLKAAVAAGADVAFLEGVETPDQARQVCKELAPTPCLLNVVPGGVTPLFSAAEAKDLGYRIVIWPVLAMGEVFKATTKAMKELKATGFAVPETDRQGKIVGGVRELFEVCGLNACAELDAKAGGKAYSDGI